MWVKYCSCGPSKPYQINTATPELNLFVYVWALQSFQGNSLAQCPWIFVTWYFLLGWSSFTERLVCLPGMSGDWRAISGVCYKYQEAEIHKNEQIFSFTHGNTKCWEIHKLFVYCWEEGKKTNKWTPPNWIFLVLFLVTGLKKFNATVSNVMFSFFPPMHRFLGVANLFRFHTVWPLFY